MLQLSEFVKNLRSSVWDVFNNFLVIDATDRRDYLSPQAYTPFHFFASTLYNAEEK